MTPNRYPLCSMPGCVEPAVARFSQALGDPTELCALHAQPVRALILEGIARLNADRRDRLVAGNGDERVVLNARDG